MSNPNPLPGYDEWKLQTPPEYDEPEERSEQDPDDARDEAIERERIAAMFEPIEDCDGT